MFILDGEMIRNKREMTARTQSEMSDIAGISRESWWIAENGLGVGISVVRKISDALKIKPELLIKEVIEYGGKTRKK